jgi:fatty-acyl-CoA synthase
VPTIRDLILGYADDEHLAILFEDEEWTYGRFTAGCVERAWLFLDHRPPEGRPFHVGALLDNGPEYALTLGAAAVCGAAVVGINPTRRGGELARDITHADTGLVVTESRHRELLDGLGLDIPVLDVDSPEWAEQLAAHRGRPAPEVEVDPLAPYLLLFTSGTTGQPKAAICSQDRLARIGQTLSATLVSIMGFSRDDRCYQVMPMFHSNALMAGWAPALTAGAVHVFRRRFSASHWLADIRRYGCTYFNYVGKPLSYVLATPEQPDDADNPLRYAFGNEGAEHDLARFAARFGCEIRDSYGSTEGGVSIQRTPDTPVGSLGVGPEGTVVLDPETMQEKPRAVFDATGRLTNADDCIGEIANTQVASLFEGYWRNPEADLERTRQAIYWTGDLGYRDEAGFFYFAGRNFDWLRVDGENFAAAPIERILVRHPDVLLAAVYAVPNPTVGDDVMAAVMLEPDVAFDPEGFAKFLAAQDDLGTKWTPRFVRVVDEDFPRTETHKILKRVLRRQRWECADAVWIRDPGRAYRRLTAEDVAALRAEFVARGREAALDAG